MADNFITNPAAGGDTFAADDIAGVKWQRVKIGHGADGSATDVSSASPLPVDSELPAAAALSDAAANPTAPMVGAAGMVYDQYTGTWKRVKSSACADGSDGTDSVAVGPQLYRGGVWEQQRAVGGDGQASTGLVAESPALYNEATFDRQRGNTEGTLLASAARTASAFGLENVNYNARGVRVDLLVAAKAAATVLNIYVCAADPVTHSLTFLGGVVGWAAAVGTGHSLEVYPGVTPVTAALVGGSTYLSRFSGALSRRWYVYVVPGDASSVTYSVGYSLIV